MNGSASVGGSTGRSFSRVPSAASRSEFVIQEIDFVGIACGKSFDNIPADIGCLLIVDHAELGPYFAQGIHGAFTEESRPLRPTTFTFTSLPSALTASPSRRLCAGYWYCTRRRARSERKHKKLDLPLARAWPENADAAPAQRGREIRITASILREYGRAAITRSCARRSLAAATIFIGPSCICWVLLDARYFSFNVS